VLAPSSAVATCRPAPISKFFRNKPVSKSRRPSSELRPPSVQPPCSPKYDQVKVVNKHLSKRLEEFKTNASKNAVALLYVLAELLARMLEDFLAPIRILFASYFSEDETS